MNLLTVICIVQQKMYNFIKLHPVCFDKQELGTGSISRHLCQGQILKGDNFMYFKEDFPK